MKYVSWPIGVNRIVHSSTTMEVAPNAVQSDQSENGTEMTLLKSSGAPDVYSVTMMFSNSTDDPFFKNHVDSNGDHITEWQAFLNWFKYTTLMGQNPFYFHKIDDPNDDKVDRSCIYKIKASGLPKGTPEGQYYKVTMTWVQFINECITVPDVEDVEVDTIFISPEGSIDLRFEEEPTTIPVKSDFTLSSDYYEDQDSMVLERIDYDGYKSCVLYFDSFTKEGTYKVVVNYKGKAITGYVIVSGE